MGYRSKVIIGVKKGESSNEFEKILKKHDFQIEHPHNSHLVVEEMDEYKTYTFDYIKWYEADDWCKEIMDWLDKTQLNKLDDCWSLGMGEDGQIHSEIGDWYEYVDVFYDIELQNN